MRSENCQCTKTVCHCCPGGCGADFRACECKAQATALERHRWELIHKILHPLTWGRHDLMAKLQELHAFNKTTLRR